MLSRTTEASYTVESDIQHPNSHAGYAVEVGAGPARTPGPPVTTIIFISKTDGEYPMVQ